MVWKCFWKVQFWVIACSLVLQSPGLNWEVRANVGEFFGFGSRVSALGGIGVAGNAGAYAAYHNPAELSAHRDKRLLFSWGLVYMQPRFTPITNVVTQNRFTADGQSTGDVDTNYKNTFGQEIALSYRLFPEWKNLSFGLVAFLPIESVAYMDTGEAYVPEYLMYRSRTQRPQIELGFGADMGKGFHLGFGIHTGFALTSNATAFINTTAGTASSMRFTSSLKPKAAPYFGILYQSPVHLEAGIRTPQFTLGSVVRLPLASDNTMTLSSAARVFGDFAAVDINFPASSTLFYDPLTVEVGGSAQHSSWGRIYGQIEYQRWSRYQTPALLIADPSTTNCRNQDGTPCNTVSITPGQTPPVQFVDIIVPRVGEEITLNERCVVRVGYAYRPGMVSKSSADVGNYLDPAKHMVSAGVGFKFDHFLNFEVPTQLDFNLAYQYLVKQHVGKSPGNEAAGNSPTQANLADAKIGSPGYDVGGNLLGGGVTLTLAF
jgi:hypothetical protein